MAGRRSGEGPLVEVSTRDEQRKQNNWGEPVFAIDPNVPAAKCHDVLRVFIGVAYSSLEFWGLVKETAMRTDAALTVQIDTPPGAKDTPEGISVTVELVVYMQRMSHSSNNNRNVAMNCS
jgi:hypothetical protein